MEAWEKTGEKRYKDPKCRLCKVGDENLGHVFKCQEARKVFEKEWIVGLGSRFVNGRKGMNWKLFKRDSVIQICEYARKFEKQAKMITDMDKIYILTHKNKSA